MSLKCVQLPAVDNAIASLHLTWFNSPMKKNKAARKATTNIRIYKDTHKILHDHASQYRGTIAGLIHSLALGLIAKKSASDNV